MPHTIAEADWKVLRRVHSLALDRYCENVLAEIERVTHSSAESLAEKANNGPLTPDEAHEYDRFIEPGDIIAALSVKAERRLQGERVR